VKIERHEEMEQRGDAGKMERRERENDKESKERERKKESRGQKTRETEITCGSRSLARPMFSVARAKQTCQTQPNECNARKELKS
jgi:hypothetical protein